MYLLCFFSILIQSMATDDSYFKVFETYRNRINFKEVFTATLSNMCKDVKLDSVRSCLAIGPAGGENEIEFIKHCAANVNKLLAIEPCHDAAEHLKTSLRTSLPGVETQVLETGIPNWDGLNDPVDLILMFHVLYFLPADERQAFFKKMHDRWLTPGGYVAIVSASRTKSPGNTHMIFERLCKPSPPWEDVEADLQKVGFSKHYAHEMRLKRDFANLDESVLGFYKKNGSLPDVTLDYVRSIIEELYPEGKADEFNMIAVFKRTI